MAKNNLDKYTSADGLGFPLNFRRGNPNPLDNSSVWSSLEAATNYAATDPTAYVGQVLTVVDKINNTATVYAIQDEAGTLKKVGTSPIGDEKTITVAEDGTVSLFGVSGLQLTREDGEGHTVKINYQPLLVEGKLTWVEPSATTVEGLASEINGIKTRLSGIDTSISGINTKIGTVPSDKTVIEMIADAKTEAIAEATYDDSILSGKVSAIEKDYLKGADKTALESKITEEAGKAKNDAIQAIMGEAGIDEKYDTLKEIADWILSDTTASAQLVTRVTTIENDYLKGADKTTLQGNIDKLEKFVGSLPEGATSTTVVAYIKEAIDGLKIGDYAKASALTALASKVTALENVGAEKNVIAAVDDKQFAIGETDRKLTLLDIAMSKVTGLNAALANKVDKVEGSRLLTTPEAEKLEKLVLNEDGSVEVSGKVAAGNVTGLGEWLTAHRDDTTGLFGSTSATKLTGIEEGAQVNDIEVVKVGGKALTITDKAVDISIGTAEALGVVMGSAEENKVAINSDGSMEVNKVNVNKLSQTDGETLILNGGSSAN